MNKIIVTILITMASWFGYSPEVEFGVAPRVLRESQGGTATSTYETGDILYSDADNSLTLLRVGSNTEVLTLAGGIPTWAVSVSGGGGGAGNVATSTTETSTYVGETLEVTVMGNTDVTGEVAVFTSDSATPATIGGDAQFFWDSGINKLTIQDLVATSGVTTTNATSTRLAVIELRPTNITDYYGAVCGVTNQFVTDVADNGTFSCTALDTTGTWSGAVGSDSTWTSHDSYPAACTAGFYAHTIGDTLSCTDATTEIDSAIATHLLVVTDTNTIGHLNDTDWDTFNNKSTIDGYAEFVQNADNQEPVSSTPFLFLNGLYASSTILLANATITDSLYVLGASFFTGQITGDVTGNLTGLASTATASADNPTNCGTGEYPLGVDTNWDAESCTDATTEINSVVNALGGTNLTCAAQSCDVDDAFVLLAGDSSSGIYTWSGLNTFSSDLRVTGQLHATSTDFDVLQVNGNAIITGNATTTGTHVVGIDGGAGTTTISMQTAGVAGSCIEWTNVENVIYREYVNGAGTKVLEAGACQ